jgi:hypothetical protein
MLPPVAPARPRATQDVDLVLPSALVDEFCSLLQDAFYVDGDMIREAIQRKASFNVVHLGTMFKADVFIMKGDSWSREEMSRVPSLRHRDSHSKAIQRWSNGVGFSR